MAARKSVAVHAAVVARNAAPISVASTSASAVATGDGAAGRSNATSGVIVVNI